MTERVRVEACRQSGKLCRPVAQVAPEYGVGWQTIMNAAIDHGAPSLTIPPAPSQ